MGLLGCDWELSQHLNPRTTSGHSAGALREPRAGEGARGHLEKVEGGSLWAPLPFIIGVQTQGPTRPDSLVRWRRLWETYSENSRALRPCASFPWSFLWRLRAN